MGLGTGGIAAIIGGIGAAGSIGSSLINANATSNAASEQEQQAQNALNFQNKVFDTNQTNIQPYLGAGSGSIAQLMAGIQNGTFGSNPSFVAPTAQQAEQTPGYQFNLQQGLKSVDEGAAARGGLQTGGTLKAEQNYGAGLASNTYQQTYTNALNSYQENLANQQQQFSQLFQPAQLGENAAVGAGSEANTSAGNVGQLLTGIGNSQAAGTIGTANAITGGINGVANSATNGLLYNQLLNPSGGGTPTGPTTGPANPGGFYSPINPSVPGGLGLPTGGS